MSFFHVWTKYVVLFSRRSGVKGGRTPVKGTHLCLLSRRELQHICGWTEAAEADVGLMNQELLVSGAGVGSVTLSVQVHIYVYVCFAEVESVGAQSKPTVNMFHGHDSLVDHYVKWALRVVNMCTRPRSV